MWLNAESSGRISATSTGLKHNGGKICLAHGVRELWTADRLFLRATGLRVRNPLATA